MQGLFFLLAYAVLMMAATMLFTKRERTAEGFLVGNRNLGTMSAALSIAATWIWAPALFVSAEKSYTNGLPGLFWFLVPNVLCLLAFIPFAKRIRQKMPNGITLSGYMAEHYHSIKVKRIYLFQLSALSVLSTGVQLLAGGRIMAALTGLQFPLMTVLLAVIAFSYSQFSGLRASVITDGVQMVLILVACIIFVPWALRTENGTRSLLAGLTGVGGEYSGLFDAAGIEVFFAFGLPTAIGLLSGPFGDQCFWQRAFAIKENKIGRAFAWGAVLFAIVPLSMGILGFIAAGSGFIPGDNSIVNLELVTHLFPTWAVLPFMLMLISGLLSTVDSNLCAAASLAADMFPGQGLKTSRTAMLVFLAAGILIANLPGLTITHLFLFYGVLRATTLLPTILTLMGKRLSGRGVYFGVRAGMLCGLPIFAYGTVHDLSGCKTIGCLFSALTPGLFAMANTRKGADRR